MKRILTFSAFAMILSFALPAAAVCMRPAEPAELPNGTTATKAEMIAAVKSVHSYQKALADFRRCLDEERAAAEAKAANDKTANDEAADDEAAKKERDITYTKRYNAAVDAEEAFVNRFNKEIRAYKNQTASKK